MNGYEIRKTPTVGGWFWVFDPQGRICRSNRTGKAVCFRGKKAARAYIRDITRK